MFFSTHELPDVRAVALLRTAAREAYDLIEQTRATVAETQLLLEVIAKIECPRIGQPNSKPISPTDEVIE